MRSGARVWLDDFREKGHNMAVMLPQSSAERRTTKYPVIDGDIHPTLRSPRARSWASFCVRKSPGGNLMMTKLTNEITTTMRAAYNNRRAM